MIETESKRCVTDVDTVRKALVQSGWNKAAYANEIDFYYRTPTGGLGRIRNCGSFTEVGTESGDRKLLSSAAHTAELREFTDGWPPKHFVKVDKTRASYLCEDLPGVRIDLDFIPGTGSFVKVRSVDPLLVEQIEIKLGIDSLTPIEAPYRDLVAR